YCPAWSAFHFPNCIHFPATTRWVLFIRYLPASRACCRIREPCHLCSVPIRVLLPQLGRLSTIRTTATKIRESIYERKLSSWCSYLRYRWGCDARQLAEMAVCHATRGRAHRTVGRRCGRRPCECPREVTELGRRQLPRFASAVPRSCPDPKNQRFGE